MYYLAVLSDSFEYLCYGSPTIRDSFILSVGIDFSRQILTSTDVRRQILTSKVDTHTVRVNIISTLHLFSSSLAEISPYSAGTVFKRQNLTSVDVRF